jgi:hypothetical protein
MTAGRNTLKSIKSSPKMAEQNFRPSDFLSQSELDELHEANANRGKIAKKYDEIDAFEAEILERFGWGAFRAYQDGLISIEQAARYIYAARAREASNRYALESLILAAVAGANNPNKHGKAPKSLKQAVDIVKTEYKRAKGAQ